MGSSSDRGELTGLKAVRITGNGGEGDGAEAQEAERAGPEHR